MKLSNAIYKASKKHKVPADLYTAILMQESRYKNGNAYCEKGSPRPDFKKIVEVCSDFGISMINIRHTELNPKSPYKFSIDKLMNDMQYSIDAGAQILSWFHKRYSKRETYWWVRYNCGTNRSIDRPTCNEYKMLVKPFL